MSWSQGLCQEPGDCRSSVPAIKFYPHPQRWPLPTPHDVATCKLLASLSHASPMAKVNPSCLLVSHHPRPSAHQAIEKRKQHEAPYALLCTSIIPGVCKSQEPTCGTAGLEHLPAPAWLALRSKCGAAEPWLSQYQLSGAVEAEPPPK